MTTFAGRVEAKAVVPSGGAAVSATIANGGTAATCTVPAAGYYLTQAGGVSSLLTTLQTQLNNNSQGYPQSTTAAANAIGGTWTGGAGWLFNIASGNDTGAFGGVTMTAVNTPTYGTAGPRSGVDLAIGFDGSTDAFSAGNNFSVGATDDLILAWVGKTTSVATDMDWVSKYTAGVGWFLYKAATNVFLLAVNDGTGSVTALSTSVAINEWHVGIAVIDRGANQIRCGIRTLSGTTYLGSATSIAGKGSFSNAANMLVGNGVITGNGADTSANIAGLYVVKGVGAAAGLSAGLSTALTNFAAAINASWSVSMSATTGLVSIGWTGYATPTWSLAWTSTTLRDVLGFTADISGVTTTQTGTKQSPMVWFPDSPLNCDDHPSMTPDETDARSSESPTGTLLTLSGNTKYAHSNVRWQRVPVDRIREASVTYANASLETFYRNCIVGTGSITWFTPGSDLQVYWSNQGTDALLGADANGSTGVAGWRPSAIPKFSDLARPSQQGWVGQFDVRIPRLVSSG